MIIQHSFLGGIRTMDARDLPFDIKKKLSKIAQRLPEAGRSAFCNSAGSKIAAFAQEFLTDNKYALVYGAIGFVLGRLTDGLIGSIPVVGWFLRPALHLLPWGLGLAGAGYGFMKDRDVERLRRIVDDEFYRVERQYGNY